MTTVGRQQLLHDAVAAATLAPSSHNTQPWRFRIRDGQLELRADLTRGLDVIDPDRRQLAMSCGCALFNARLVIRGGGFDDEVEEVPDPGDPSLMARLRCGIPRAPTERERALIAAIPHRHTNRRPFLVRPVAQTITDALAVDAHDQRAWMVRATPDQKRELGRLVAEADRAQLADPAFCEELSRWLAGPFSTRDDGIPLAEKEYGASMPFASLVRIRSAHLGEQLGALEDERTQGAPVVAILGTDRDEPTDWLDCGQALQAVLLHATHLGLAAAFMNQVLEVPVLRGQVTRVVGRANPQMIVRMGYAAPVEHLAPRRRVVDVLD
jgi:nitroreductase